MAYRVRPCRSLDELGRAASAIGHYFGWVPSEEEVERFSQALPLERMHATFDGKEIVGGAGVFPFEMTVPGGPVQCAGVTVVGVLPTHRRRGLLSRMMRVQIDDIHERGEPFAALWASEATIYVRFGYGLASLTHEIRLPRTWAALRAGTPPRSGQVRLVEHDEAAKTFPRLYDKVRRETPGFLSRSKTWWENRRLRDDPSRRPPGAGPLNRALFELDGRPAGYALYRLVQSEENGDWKRRLRVVEAFGPRRGCDPRDLAVPARGRLDARDRGRPAAHGPPAHPPRRAPRPPGICRRTQGSGSAWSTSARASRRAATGRTAGSRSSSGTRSARGTRGRGRSRTASRSGRAGARTCASTSSRSERSYLGGFSFAQLSRAGLGRGGVTRRARPRRRAVRDRSRALVS